MVKAAADGSGPGCRQHPDFVRPAIDGPIAPRVAGWISPLLVAALLLFGVPLLLWGRLEERYFWWLLIAYVVVAVVAGQLLLRAEVHRQNRTEGALVAIGVAIAVIVLAVELGVDGRREARARDDALRDRLAAETLDGQRLEAVDLEGFVITERSARNAQFNGSSLSGFTLTATDLTGASFVDVTNVDGPFVDANYRTIITGSTLERASFVGANLERANFRDSLLRGADFTDFVCIECDFRDTDLLATDLSVAADLTGSIFNAQGLVTLAADVRELGAIVLGGNSTGARIEWLPTEDQLVEDAIDFNRTNLAGADLSGLDLGFSNLGSVNLEGANLNGADLSDVIASNVLYDDTTQLDDVTITDLDCTTADCDRSEATGPDQVFGSLPVRRDAEPPNITAAAALEVLANDDGRSITLTPGTWILTGELTDVTLQDIDSGTFALLADGITIDSGTFDTAQLSGSSFLDADLGTTSWTGTRLDSTRLGGANLQNTTGLATANVADPINGQLIFYNEATDLPAELTEPPEFWFNLDNPAPFEIKTNFIVSGIDLSAPGPNVGSLAQGGDYPNFQARNAGLRFRNFTGANLLISDFVESDLRGAAFQGATLVAANLDGALLDPIPEQISPGSCTTSTGQNRSQFCGAVYDNLTNWPIGYTPPIDAINLDGDLTNANLGGRILEGIGTNRSLNAPGATLDTARIRGVDFRGSNFSGATFTRTQAVGTNLSASDLTGVDFTCADLSGAILRGSDLTGAILDGTNLTGADLTDATLTPGALDTAQIDNTTILPNGFTPPTSPTPPNCE